MICFSWALSHENEVPLYYVYSILSWGLFRNSLHCLWTERAPLFTIQFWLFSVKMYSQFPLSGRKLATTESRYQARCYFTFSAFFGCHLHESYEVYKLLAFTSLIRSVIISPFFHHIIFSLARSYLGAIVTSKVEVSASFILRTNTVQYACVLDYAWRTNLQFETGLKKAEEKTEVQCTEKQNLKIKKQNSWQQA